MCEDSDSENRGSTGKGPLKIPYAEHDGKIVHISAVERGLACGCRCPGCGGTLIARKGQKTQPHFAHHGEYTCNAETVLHRLGKKLAYERILSSLPDYLPIQISWTCSECDDKHTSNLLTKAKSAELEVPIGNCRPDIVLRDAASRPIIFLEIVVSHKPEPQVLEFAKQSKIAIVQFGVNGPEDLEIIEKAAEWPVSVYPPVCKRPRCSNCHGPLFEKTLHVVKGDCWKCHKEMCIAYMDVDHERLAPDDFMESDIQIAKQHGVVLQVRYSKTVGEKYLANICPHCGSMLGKFFLHDYWDLPGEHYQTGLRCRKCKFHMQNSA